MALTYPPHYANRGINDRYNELQRITTGFSKPLKRSTMSTASRELPMPNVSKLSSLDQAQATLMFCFTKLSRLARDLPLTSPGPASQPPSPIVDEDRQHFQKWLEQWEFAFTVFLTNAMATMSNEEVTQSRILKANHLACTILAADDPPARDAFEDEFHAIIELAGAVLRSRYLADSPQGLRSNEPSPMSASLDVRDPLYVVHSRCKHATIRNRAIELLSQFYSDFRI